LTKQEKGLFVKFTYQVKFKTAKLIKILKNREFTEKNGNKMAIDLTLLFIYNYYGENSGEIFSKTAAKICAKAKIYI
jgi:hypothetical protein